MLPDPEFERMATELFRFIVAVLLVAVGLGAGLTAIGLYMLAQALAEVFA